MEVGPGHEPRLIKKPEPKQPIYETFVPGQSVTLDEFPVELILEIFSYLSLAINTKVLPLVQRSWKELLQEERESIQRIFKGKAQEKDIDSLRRKYSDQDFYTMLCEAALHFKEAQDQLLQMIQSKKWTIKTAPCFYASAIRGNPWAQYCLASIYSNYPRLGALEIKWLERAQEQGLLHAQLFLKSTADKGLAEAQYVYTKYCRNHILKLKLSCLGLEQRYPPAMYEHFLRLSEPNNLWLVEQAQKNLKTFKWLIFAAKSGHEGASFTLGRYVKIAQNRQVEPFSEGLLRQLQLYESTEIRKKSKISEEPFILGQKFEDGYDPKISKYLHGYQPSCEKNRHPEVRPFILGLLYATGTIFEQDEEKALAYFLRGAKDQIAICVLSFEHEIMNYIKERAEKGQAEYQYLMGVILSSSRSYLGFDDSHEEAIVWFQKAADQGHFESAFRLFSYFSGLEGVAFYDLPQAQKFFNQLTQNDPLLKQILLEDIVKLKNMPIELFVTLSPNVDLNKNALDLSEFNETEEPFEDLYENN